MTVTDGKAAEKAAGGKRAVNMNEDKRASETEFNDGFAPVIDENSEVLILGSFPSVKSREVGFYYGNPQNRFWKTLAKWANEPELIKADTNGKIEFLKKHKIALWDVIEKCAIAGSGDADITEGNSVPADVNSVLCVPRDLKLIVCNGKKAYSVFLETVKNVSVKTIYLPSTSSANPRFNEKEWRAALDSVFAPENLSESFPEAYNEKSDKA